MAKKTKKSKSQKNSTSAKIRAAYTKIKNAKEKAQARATKALKVQMAAEKAENKKLKSKQKKAVKNAKGLFGAFGKAIKFQVKDPYNLKGKHKFFAPDELQREVRARWDSYELLGRKPKKAFVGPDAASVTITVTLSADHGINPRTMLEKIRRAIEKGQVEYLVIGGKIVGGQRYYIESMSETWDRFFRAGRLIHATCELRLVEYH